MPRISFRKSRPPLEVPMGANLMESLLASGLPVASSCYGDAVCGKCKVEIISGEENLSPIEPAEAILMERLSIAKEYRISCQVRVFGDITIDAAYW